MPPYLAKVYFLKQSAYSRTPVVCQISSYHSIGTCKKNEKLCNYERNKGQETSTLRVLCEQHCNEVTLSITLIHHKGHWKGLEGQQDGNLMVTRMLNDTARFQGPKEYTLQLQSYFITVLTLV